MDTRCHRPTTLKIFGESSELFRLKWWWWWRSACLIQLSILILSFCLNSSLSSIRHTYVSQLHRYSFSLRREFKKNRVRHAGAGLMRVDDFTRLLKFTNILRQTLYVIPKLASYCRDSNPCTMTTIEATVLTLAQYRFIFVEWINYVI